MIRLEAPAKINPYLSVGAGRDDGLHEIVSVMQAVALFDAVEVSAAPSLEVDVDPADAAPAGEDNLAARAARALAVARGIEPRARIRLTKRIPAAAGLAGGSADAAAALVGLNRFWDVNLSRKALERIAAGIGSDVAFCVRGGTAAVFGGGDEVVSLPARGHMWWVLGISDMALPTAEVYAEYDRLGGGALGDPHAAVDALARGDVERLAASLRNDLEPAAVSLAPSIAGGRDALVSAGAAGAVLSGSGPTWAGLCRDEEHARAVASAATAAFARVEVVESVTHGPRIAG